MVEYWYFDVIRSVYFVVVRSDHVVKKANIATTSTGNDIATFREVSALSPRGRYDIKFYPTFVHLHGKTFDYKVKEILLVQCCKIVSVGVWIQLKL